MGRSDRLFDTLQILRDGKLHRAQDIAARLHVSCRTIYRDMETLAASGVPVTGTRGEGYRLTEAITLPPLTLAPDELEALNLGMAIVGEAVDPELKAAALRLADKIDAALPAAAVPQQDAWKFAASPLASAARGFAHLATLRAAIKARQKVRLRYILSDGGMSDHVLRPLGMEYLGRVWSLTGWSEERATFDVFRVDLIARADPLPELFTDEPGKTLADYRSRPATSELDAQRGGY